MRKFTILSVIMFFSILTFGQSQRWKAERNSIVMSTGTNHFMGDLGGGKKDAAHFMGVRDMDFVTTRPTFQFGYRYRFTEYFSFRANLTYALLTGRDDASGNINRKSRNLSFRSSVYELSGQFEYYFIKEKEVPRYSFSSLRSVRNISAYVFIGVGGFYFNPKAKDNNGTWHDLRPLNTEGQGTNFSYIDWKGDEMTTPDPYGKIAVCIPIGLGMKYNINRKWAIGLEISNRYTSTDYLDDAHDRYFNYNDDIVVAAGITPPSEMSVFFADRHLEVVDDQLGGDAEDFQTGQSFRGEPSYNDSYILTLVTVHYKLKRGNGNLPKFR